MEECEIKVTRLFKTNKTGSNYGFTIETKNYNKSVYPPDIIRLSKKLSGFVFGYMFQNMS